MYFTKYAHHTHHFFVLCKREASVLLLSQKCESLLGQEPHKSQSEPNPTGTAASPARYMTMPEPHLFRICLLHPEASTVSFKLAEPTGIGLTLLSEQGPMARASNSGSHSFGWPDRRIKCGTTKLRYEHPTTLLCTWRPGGLITDSRSSIYDISSYVLQDDCRTTQTAPKYNNKRGSRICGYSIN